MEDFTPPSRTLSAAQASPSQQEAAQPSRRKPSVKSPARIRAQAQAGAKSAGRAQAGAKVPSLALTKPAHVREAAAALFNRAYKRWGAAGSAAEMRTSAYFLNMVRASIRDVELEGRIRQLEEQSGIRPPSEGSTELPAD